MRPAPPLWSLALLALAGGTPGFRPEAARAAVEERTLDNGLRVLVAPLPGSGAAACRVALCTGSSDDPTATPGLTRLVARLLDKGTSRVGVRDLVRERPLRQQVLDVEDALRELRREALERFRRGEGPDPDDPASRPASVAKLREGLAAVADLHRRELIAGELQALYARAGATEIRSWVEADATVFAVTLAPARLELFFACEADRLANAVLRDVAATRDELARARREAIDDDPALPAHDAFRAVVWGGHPYGNLAAGSVSLDGIAHAELERWKARMVAPANVVVCVAGDVKPDAVFALAERWLAPLAGAARPREEAWPRAPQALGPRRLETAARAPSAVTLAWNVPASGHRDEAALEVLAALLSGRHGRLERALAAVEPPLALATFAHLEPGRLGSTFAISAEAAGDDALAKLEGALLEQAERLRREPVAVDEVERGRASAVLAFEEGAADASTLATEIARAEARGARRDRDVFRARIRFVEAADVLRVAQTYLAPERRATLALHRTEGAKPPAPAPPRPDVVALAEKPPAPASAPASAPAIVEANGHAAPTGAVASHPASGAAADASATVPPASKAAAPAPVPPPVLPAAASPASQPASAPAAAASQPAAPPKEGGTR